jgi:predicted phosphodiesterase
LNLAESVRKLVVLGDPHGALEAVEKILDREAGGDVCFLCVGDVVGRRDGPTCSRLVAFLRDRGVHTVRGNHEEWVSPEGCLELVDSPEDDPRLSPEALQWVRALPAGLEIFHPGLGRRVATVVHSLRDPRWREVDEENARQLAESLGGPDLIFTGHTHRPRFLPVPRRGDVRGICFDFVAKTSCRGEIPEAGSLVVDAGSVGLPDPSDFTPEFWTQEARSHYGTYAWVDLVERRVELRRVFSIG